MPIQDNKLIREIQTKIADNIVGYEQRCIITKDEFIACYNAWIKENKNDSTNT